MFVDNVVGFGVDVNDVVDDPARMPTIIYHPHHTGQMQLAVNLDKASEYIKDRPNQLRAQWHSLSWN